MISVVIPLYNKAHTIVNTLNTVFAQTYQDFEVVIVNDGSTDNGVEVIQQHFDDKRIRIIHQKNAGVSIARNRGVDESKGDYIAFLDGDDEWHPEYLSTIHELIVKYPEAGLFLCAGLIYNADGSVSYRIASKYGGQKLPINIFENPEVFSHTSATIVKKETFNRTHRFIPGMKRFEDYLASQATALITQTIYCGIPLTKYRGGIPGQLTQQNSFDAHITDSELLYFNTIVRDFLQTKGENPVCPIFLSYFLRHSIKLMLRERNYTKLDLYLTRLNPEVLSLLNKAEQFIYKKHMYLCSIIWINLTKVRWRLHKYPIVGQRVNISRIPKQYLTW